ncbi:Bestrophin homolog [Gryllus bimaculatus]|nr:Bestrophin homolog [Gryllus bimaculatus]
MESEKKIFEMMDEKTDMSKYWMPLIWATNIINRARKEALIPNDHVVQTMLVELSDIRRRLGSLIGYDTVVTLAVYTYFVAALMGRQPVTSPDGEMAPQTYYEMFFPLFTVLQFFFYVGWCCPPSRSWPTRRRRRTAAATGTRAAARAGTARAAGVARRRWRRRCCRPRSPRRAWGPSR